MLFPAFPLPFTILFTVFVCSSLLSLFTWTQINVVFCCCALLCSLSAIPAVAQPRLHTPARLTDRFVVSSAISHSQIVYVTWRDLMFIWFILISFASSLWSTGLVVKKKYNRYSEDTEVYYWDFFSPFLAVTRFIPCPTPISGVVFMCLFAKGLTLGLCGLWVFEGLNQK